MRRVDLTALLVTFGAILVFLLFWGAVGYVAFHFLHKFW